MSAAIDTNLLVYAANEDSREHEAAARFLEARAHDTELLMVPWSTVWSFLRLATSPRVFSKPMLPAQAQEFIKALTDLPQVRLLAEEQGFMKTWTEVTRTVVARGPDVTDVHLATMLKFHGVKTLYTNDVGFRRFGFLRVINPLET